MTAMAGHKPADAIFLQFTFPMLRLCGIFILIFRKKYIMRNFFLLPAIAILLFSCGNADKKGKETVQKDTAVTNSTETGIQKKEADQPVIADSIKTATLVFSGYEEGDYAHLLFTEAGTGTEYDFGHPDDNNLGTIALVIKDDKTSFGYKENSKMKGTKFDAELIYKMVDTYDESGQPKKGKEWRIRNLKKLNK